MKTNLSISLCVLIVAMFAGCASGGMFTASNITEVQLQKNNFIIVARNVSGEAEAGYLFGSTFSLGMMTNTVAALRVSGTGMLYKEALEDLWKNYEAVHGPVEGKKLALVNVRYDADALNLFVYTRPKVMIRADVVEFTN
jgi:hypothetical protein